MYPTSKNTNLYANGNMPPRAKKSALNLLMYWKAWGIPITVIFLSIALLIFQIIPVVQAAWVEYQKIPLQKSNLEKIKQEVAKGDLYLQTNLSQLQEYLTRINTKIPTTEGAIIVSQDNIKAIANKYNLTIQSIKTGENLEDFLESSDTETTTLQEDSLQKQFRISFFEIEMKGTNYDSFKNFISDLIHSEGLIILSSSDFGDNEKGIITGKFIFSSYTFNRGLESQYKIDLEKDGNFVYPDQEFLQKFEEKYLKSN
jgi:hypothetical protein